MSLHGWLAIAGGAALLAFVIFAFRQGQKVKPDDRHDSSRSGDGTETL
ncbi:MAG: hypothetical protein AB1490_29625 [Pseudomonadota bacterium]